MPTPAEPRAARAGWVAVAAMVLVLSTLTACASKGPSSSAPDGRIPVVAAENFWGSIAAQLGGRQVDVVSIISNPAIDPHDYEPTAGDGRAVAQAAYVVENGVGYDSWAAKLVAANDTAGQRVLDVGQLLGLKRGANPHRWYVPADVERVIRRITADYVRLDPAHATYFRQRARSFERTTLARYHGLLSKIRARYAGTAVGASESIFDGLASATGLRLVTPAAYLDAISEGTDPTAADKATVDRQVEQRQIKVWVFNSQNATPDVQAVTRQARARGIPVATVTETMAPAATTFQDWQVRQLASLETALAKATGR
ncbi:MAG TPA: zinc ABC transporter substrate-binding protein [Acidimicrobiales bacterium]